MGSGGGDVGKAINKQINNAGSYFGFNVNNGWKWDGKSGIAHVYDESFGELDGRNKARAALNQSQGQFDIAQKQSADLIAQQQWTKQQNDSTASSTANAATATANATSGLTYANATPQALGPGFNGGPSATKKDFLGL